MSLQSLFIPAGEMNPNMNKKILKSNNFKGFSMVELLVVVVIFSMIGYLTTVSIALTMRGARKSEALLEVRSNVSYSMSIMERLLRGARDPNCLTPFDSLGVGDNLGIEYYDQAGQIVSFSCEGGVNGYIASASARITNDKVNIDCSAGNIVFNCLFPGGGIPPTVLITLNASSAEIQGPEGAEVTQSTQVLLRSY